MSAPAAKTEPTPEQLAEARAAEQFNQEIKALLKRYSLARAIVETKTDNVTFDAALIERLLAKDAAAYTEIAA